MFEQGYCKLYRLLEKIRLDDEHVAVDGGRGSCCCAAAGSDEVDADDDVDVDGVVDDDAVDEGVI